jgi:hypothetical protein
MSYDLITVVRRSPIEGGPDFPQILSRWRDWCHTNYARVRWSSADFELLPDPSQEPLLVILFWDDSGAENPPALIAPIRRKWPNSRLVVAGARTDIGSSVAKLPDPPPVVASFGTADFVDLLNTLGLQLRAVERRLHDSPSSGEAGYQAIVERLNSGQLPNIVEKYFHENTRIAPVVIGSGWSGDPVIQLNVTGPQPSQYYLKLAFFRRDSDMRASVQNALKAQEWLGEKTVRLHPPVGGFGPDPAQTLMELFPGFADRDGKAYLPLCWKSASSAGASFDRETFRDQYLRQDVDNLSTSVASVISALQRGQSDRWDYVGPSQEPERGAFFYEDYERRDSSRKEVESLRRYASACAVWKGHSADFDACANALSHRVWPRWIAARDANKRVGVRVGHVHGDPNSGNILVGVEKAEDIILVDCGSYRSDGFRVSDLARMEAEIKFLLMESDCDGYADIDPGRLNDWIAIERKCLEQGLSLSEAFVENQFSYLLRETRRAYRLIAIIRQAANTLCKPHDPTGQHYFAALVGTSLRWLPSRYIRTPKKLLAVFSAAEILRLSL